MCSVYSERGIPIMKHINRLTHPTRRFFIIIIKSNSDIRHTHFVLTMIKMRIEQWTLTWKNAVSSLSIISIKIPLSCSFSLLLCLLIVLPLDVVFILDSNFSARSCCSLIFFRFSFHWVHFFHPCLHLYRFNLNSISITREYQLDSQCIYAVHVSCASCI